MNQVLDVQIIENVKLLNGRKLIVYGTSSRAESMWELIQHTKLEIAAVCDGSANKIGKYFHGHQIQSFSKCQEMFARKDVFILICSQFINEIISDCERNSLKQWDFITAFGFQYAYLLNRNNKTIDAEFRYWYEQEFQQWHYLKTNQYAAFRRNHYWDLLMQLAFSDPILIYQCGKVGSTTIQDSLKDVCVNSMHVHFLMPQFNYFTEKETPEVLKILKQIQNKKRDCGKKIKIISLVRDPLSRDLSDVFYRAWNPYNEMSNSFMELACKNVNTFALQSLENHFSGMNAKQLPFSYYKGNYYQYIADRTINGFTFNWFDEELKQTFDIDVYQYPFDKEKGYSIIRSENVECLLIKLEKLNQCCEVLQKFLAIPSFQIKKSNEGANNDYAYTYQECKKTLVLPEKLLKHYYENERIKFFYTEDEIASFRKKWKIQ